jgi:hypothetical protein
MPKLDDYYVPNTYTIEDEQVTSYTNFSILAGACSWYMENSDRRMDLAVGAGSLEDAGAEARPDLRPSQSDSVQTGVLGELVPHWLSSSMISTRLRSSQRSHFQSSR